MLLFLLAGVVGVTVGMTGGGRFGNLASVSLRVPALVWSALAIQVWLAATSPRPGALAGRFAMLLISYVAVGGWLALNAVANPALRPAFGLLAVGWMMNLAAIVPNGGMPVSGAALARSGIPSEIAVDEGHLGKHVPAASSTVVPWLGDVIPARPLRSVISVGDLVMCAGIASGTIRSMRSPSATSRAAVRHSTDVAAPGVGPGP